MGSEENKKIVLAQFELLNRGDVAGAAALWASECSNHGRKVGPAGIVRVYESLKVLGEQHTLHELIAEDDWVAVRTTCVGRFSGRPELPVNGGVFSGREPNRRTYEVQHIHLFRVQGGKLVEHWASRDDLGAARQVGLDLTPSPEAAPPG